MSEQETPIPQTDDHNKELENEKLRSENEKIQWEIKELKRLRWRPWIIIIASAIPGIYLLMNGYFQTKWETFELKQERFAKKEDSLKIKTELYKDSMGRMDKRLVATQNALVSATSERDQLKIYNDGLKKGIKESEGVLKMSNPEYLRVLKEKKVLMDSILQLNKRISSMGMTASMISHEKMNLSIGLANLRRDYDKLLEENRILKQNQNNQ